MAVDPHQAAYRKVHAHLIAQGKRAVSKHGSCMYRTPEGLACAVGCLIPDKELAGFNESDLCEAVSEIRHQCPSLKYLGTRFLEAIQGVHDSKDNWDADGFNTLGRRELRAVAQTFDLVPVPNG